MQPDLAAMRRWAEALDAMLKHYTELVNCGDCGFWDPESELQVIRARAALAELQAAIKAAEEKP